MAVRGWKDRLREREGEREGGRGLDWARTRYRKDGGKEAVTAYVREGNDMLLSASCVYCTYGLSQP